MENHYFQRSRRRFLGQTLGLLGAPLLLSISRANEQQSIIKRPIPHSGELLPIIGLGTSRTFDVGNDEAERERLLQVLQTFFDLGGGLIDSSPMYGNAEQVVGDLLKKVKNKEALFAATKVWTDGKQNGRDQMELSKQRMGVNRFDLLQVHNLRDWQVHLETLKEWKAQDRVRYIGITTSHSRYHDELETVMKREPLDFVQFSYNIDNLKAEQRLLPLAQERGIATLINRPFQRGDLFKAVQGKQLPEWAKEFDCKSWAQFFLKYIAGHPGVTCIIPATSKVHHMQDNMGAAYGRLPDALQRERMRAYFTAL